MLITGHKGSMRYFIGILAVVVLIFLGVILFTGHGKKTPSGPVVTPKTLPDFATTDAQVRLTIDGVINGDDAHRQIRITIGQSVRTVDVIQGYQGNVVSTESFPNNEEAYSVFLHAVDSLGFTKSRKTTLPDETGACPLGNRYTYQLTNSDGSDFSRWASSCSGLGTFGGNVNALGVVFRRQITNFTDFTNNVNLL